jgi:ferredoxin
MRIVVDWDLCESNAVCMGIAPTVFEVDDDDSLQLLQERPPEDMREKIQEAIRRCPKLALSLEED